MSESVRFRTLPTPDDPQEQAFRQALEELEAAVRELAAEDADPDLMSEARGAARTISRAWQALPVESPYRGVIGDAVVLVHQVAELAWEIDPAIARDLEEAHADLVQVEARRRVMEIVTAAVAEAGVRKLAKETGISLGHVSDLSNGRGGLPQARTARAIDEVLGSSIEGLVQEARADATKIRQAARQLEREGVRRAATTAPSATDALTRINLALAGDQELLALVQRLIEMPGRARRGLQDLLSSLGEV